MSDPGATRPSAWRSSLTIAGGVLLIGALADLCGRELARRSLLAALGVGMSEGRVLGLALVGTTLVQAGARLRDRRRLAIAALLTLAFTAGVVAQLRLGARLQSDGFYYYAYLRSISFDRDVDFTNDYRLLGLGDKPYLFEPTVTAHAQSAWTIGPAIVWSPFFSVGHLVARGLNARGQPVSIDGTSFPYRQAVCLAGLFYGVLGLWWCGRLASAYVRSPIAILATIGIGGGSFILWYIVKEPTMTHAPSLAAVAGFCLLWARTSQARSRPAWLALGLLAGLMTDIRWQNAIFCLLPAIEIATKIFRRKAEATNTRTEATTRAEDTKASLRDTIVGDLIFAVAALVAFLPQMLAWKAIYGSLVAISPLGPQIRWTAPQIVDILWSSRNGLFATSPVAYVAALGLIAFAWREPRIGVPAIATFAAMVYFNAALQDWWGSAALGMRRFDGVLPFLTIGLAVALDWTERAIVRHPRVVLGSALAGLVLWNLTFMSAAILGEVRIGEALSFRRLAGAQAATLLSWTGHPFSYPANLLYGLRHGVRPERYDQLGPNRFLSDPLRPYGRIDIGEGSDFEAAVLGPDWHGAERDGLSTFRWAPQEAGLDVPLDVAADLAVRIRLKAFAYPGAPAQTLILDINGTRLGFFEVQPEWQVLETTVSRAVWRAGANRVTLRFAWQASPASVGLGGDPRSLSAAVDYFRLEKVVNSR
ncbi:MAG: hypothetical protein HYZ58_12675 [Acidobacteria bacterium]|nr:hypothetical protein [Acidobacteriota bacterium]